VGERSRARDHPDERLLCVLMSSSKHAHPQHAVTPPKGRPTPTRRGSGSGPTFGSTFQWSVAIGALAVAFVVLVLVTR
jgi:hypothetical protein